MGGSAVVAFLWLLPQIDQVKSARQLAEAFHRLAGPEADYVIYPRIDPAVLFYVGRPAIIVDGESELHRFIEQAGESWVMIERDDLAELSKPTDLREVFRDEDLLQGYILLTSAGPETTNDDRLRNQGTFEGVE